MRTDRRPVIAGVLRYVLGTLICLTLIPLLAVLVVLPFAGRVALAFQYDASLAAPRALDVSAFSFLQGLISPSTISPAPNGTITGKVTGGGTIAYQDATIRERGRTFGFVAQNISGTCDVDLGCPAKGHFNYVNHDTGTHINGPVDHLTITSFNSTPGQPTTGSATFTGIDTQDSCGRFTVQVEDNAEPGIHVDRFGLITCSTSSETTGTKKLLSGGNIQIHPTQGSAGGPGGT